MTHQWVSPCCWGCSTYFISLFTSDLFSVMLGHGRKMRPTVSTAGSWCDWGTSTLDSSPTFVTCYRRREGIFCFSGTLREAGGDKVCTPIHIWGEGTGYVTLTWACTHLREGTGYVTLTWACTHLKEAGGNRVHDSNVSLYTSEGGGREQGTWL